MTRVGKYRFWRSCTGVVLVGVATMAGLSLIVEHRNHLWEYAPYLLLLACPLMHLFGHGHDRGHGATSNGGEDAPHRPSAHPMPTRDDEADVQPARKDAER